MRLTVNHWIGQPHRTHHVIAGQLMTKVERPVSELSQPHTRGLPAVVGLAAAGAAGGARAALGALPKRPHRVQPLDLQITRSLTAAVQPYILDIRVRPLTTRPCCAIGFADH
jgi:hypothetical protein